jgi:EpsI family protein
MITKRLLALQVFLFLGLGVVFVMPKYKGVQPLGVTLSLPSQIGEWSGNDKPVSEKERQVLGADTEFARKSYLDFTGNEVYVSVVLAGQDVNTSLHRPERCLPAQGWTIIDKKTVKVPAKLGSRSYFEATRLRNEGSMNDGATNVYSIYYYWFVGCNDVIPSPFERSLIDWRDRLFKGYNQRWAYVTVATSMRMDSPAAEKSADGLIKGLIAQLFPKIWKPATPEG